LLRKKEKRRKKKKGGGSGARKGRGEKPDATGLSREIPRDF